MAIDGQKQPYTIAVIGAGLFGLSTVERLIASVPEYIPDRDREVHIHLIDPCLGRGSRTWLTDQPSELWMNSHAGQMTLFTDDSSSCEGPVRKGPTLQEWAAAAGVALSEDESLDRLVDASSPYRWASRSVMGKYMDWFLVHVSENAPSNARVFRHQRLVVEIESASGSPEESESVWLAGEPMPLICNRVVLAQGGPPVDPTPQQRELNRTLSSYGGSYEPPGQALPAKTAHIKPGESVLLRGLGLTFYDYLQLFTTVRGGTFRRTADNSLVYVPSGDEPRIFATSRTGVLPYPNRWWPKMGHLTKCAVPQFTSPHIFIGLAQSRDSAAALREATARMSSELLYFYYFELLTSDPDRCVIKWDRFRPSFLNFDPDSTAQEEFVASVVPEEHRLDLKRMMDPLRGREFRDLESLQTWMRRYVARMTNRSLSTKYSCDLALRNGLVYLNSCITEAASRSHESNLHPDFYREIWDWVQARVRFLTGGAPWPRQLELQALSRSGVLTFLGKACRTTVDPESRKVKFESENVPEIVDITHVIEARHSFPSVARTADPLRRKLHRRGEMTWRAAAAQSTSDVLSGPQMVAVTPYGGLIGADNSVSRTRYAVGADTSNPVLTPGLPRAETDSDVFHMTDRVARYVLRSLVCGLPEKSPEE